VGHILVGRREARILLNDQNESQKAFMWFIEKAWRS
jgi:hypothetical protein